MEAPDKVVIECTAHGFTATVSAGNVILFAKHVQLVNPGFGVAIPPLLDIFDVLDDFSVLASEIDDAIAFGPLGIAGALLELQPASPASEPPNGEG